MILDSYDLKWFQTTMKYVFLSDWGEWHLETFFGQDDGVVWEQVTLDEALFYDLEDFGWDEWDHNTRMMELNAAADETVKEMKEKNMEVSIDSDENCEEIFVLGIHKDLIPIARALLLWN